MWNTIALVCILDLTTFAQKQVKHFNKADVLEMLFQKILIAPDATVAQQLLESPPVQ
jgi:hypothetical protein